MDVKLEYDELVKRLAAAEEIIDVLRNQEVDAIVGTKNVLLLRLKGTEEELKKQNEKLKQLVADRDNLINDLSQKENRFQILLENLRSGVALIDEQGQFITINSTFLKMFGLSRKSNLLNVNSQDWNAWQVYEEDGKTLIQVDDHPVRKAALTGQVVRNKLVGVRLPSGGDLIWMYINVEPILKPDGKIQYLIATYSDITERKLSGDMVRTTQRLLQELIDGAPNFIYVKDLAGRFITINRHLETLLGMTRDNIKNKTDYDLISKDQADNYRENDRKVAENDKSLQFEEDAYLVDGIRHYLIANKFPLHDSNGKVYAVAGISTDVTELTRIQNALIESENKLHESQLIGNLGNWEWNIQTGEVKWSKGLYAIYGVDPDTFIPSISSFSEFVHPDDRQFVNTQMDKIMSGAKTFNFDFRIVLADGSTHIINTRGVISERDKDGRPRLVVGLNQDITERKKTEEALEQYTHDLETYRNHLEEMVNQRTQELQTLSHRLVTAQEEERRHISRELHDQIGQSLTLVNSLLARALRSPESHLSDINEAKQTTKEVLSQVRALSLSLHPGMLEDLGLLPTLQWYLADLGKKTDINIKFTHSGLDRKFGADIDISIYRIIQEAFTNIVKYAEVKEAWVFLNLQGQTLTLKVEDKGKGFALESQKKGVGLRGMRDRVNALNGKFKIRSVPGEGTLIEVDLPVPS